MTEEIGIVIPGGAGRMGRMLIAEVQATEGVRLAGVLVRPGHDWVGQDVGLAMGEAPLGVIASDDLVTTMACAQAVIDFTTPDATLEIARLAAQARAVHVIGTTGFSEEHLTALAPCARHSAIIRAGNMSLGVNLLTALTRQVAAALGESFDIEIRETHHRHKIDAPSGTALMLGDAAAAARGKPLRDLADRGRDGITGARETGRIGFSCSRGGDVVGEHDVMFLGAGERLTLSHIATDRAIFARGAIRAALWGQAKAPGQYDMTDVLGL